jgi:DNA-binding LacI/PurR family transcriptional regulator
VAACALLDVPDRPTALICGTERIALGVLQEAHALHVAVPAALSVLALGESWLAAASTPPLTTIGLPPEVLGEQAALLLLNRMSGGEAQSPGPAVGPPVLVERGSTAPYAPVPEVSADLPCMDGG